MSKKLMKRHVSPEWQSVEKMVYTKKTFLLERKSRTNYRPLSTSKIRYRSVQETYTMVLHRKRSETKRYSSMRDNTGETIDLFCFEK
jgi:hypothetical protein